MTNSVKIRFICLTLLWIILAWMVVKSAPFTLKTAFILIASAIVVFVPMYKKYMRKPSHDDTQGKR